MAAVERRAPAGARRRRDRRRRAARRRRGPRLPAVPAGVAGSASDRRLLPRRRLGARQPGLRRSLLPRPVRPVGRHHRVGQLPARAGGAVPGRGRRRLRGRAMDRGPRRRPRAGSPASWRWPGGARAATSPPSPASWPATPAAPRSSGQLLVTPVTDCDMSRPSYSENGDGLRPDRPTDALVLGLLRRPGRAQRPQGVTAARRSVEPAAGHHRDGGVRSAARRRDAPTPRRWRPRGCRFATWPPGATSTPR